MEEKIKTYGIQLIPGVTMRRIRDVGDRLMPIQQDLAEDVGPDDLFHLISIMQIPGNRLDALVVLDSAQGNLWEPADLITFHGPHFGDRYRILQTALNCLETDRILLLAAACAGASISLLFRPEPALPPKPPLQKDLKPPNGVRPALL